MRLHEAGLVVASIVACWPCIARAEANGAPMAVERWWHPTDKDWISVAVDGDDPRPDTMRALGYTQEQTQFYVALVGTDSTNQVAVYRWFHPSDADWVTVPEGSISDAQMTAWGYQQKTFQFFAWKAAGNGRVAVYRWWLASDGDWITLRDGEISDAQMIAWGYQQKTLLFYAYPSKTGPGNYFSLGAASTIMSQWGPPPSGWETAAPHTLSVVEANREGWKYWGYYGLQDCGGIGIVVSQDLRNWLRVSATALFSGNGERWPSVLLIGGVFYMVHTVDFCGTSYIVKRTSTDGRNFSTSSIMVAREENGHNQNPTLFRNPTNGRFYLYWYRGMPGRWEIRVRSATTFAGLANAASKVLAYSPAIVAAPQMMYRNSKYYLSTETWEFDEWRTRVLVGTTADGQFSETTNNPVLVDGSACFFQHVFNNKLYGYYCKESTPGAWTLDMRVEP